MAHRALVCLLSVSVAHAITDEAWNVMRTEIARLKATVGKMESKIADLEAKCDPSAGRGVLRHHDHAAVRTATPRQPRPRLSASTFSPRHFASQTPRYHPES